MEELNSLCKSAKFKIDAQKANYHINKSTTNNFRNHTFGFINSKTRLQLLAQKTKLSKSRKIIWIQVHDIK